MSFKHFRRKTTDCVKKPYGHSNTTNETFFRHFTIMKAFSHVLILLSMGFLFTGQQCQKKTSSFKELPQSLFQSWVHSYEEDSDSGTVYRPQGYKLPLSRGRTGFAIRKGGRFEQYDIAPTDGLEKSEGNWTQVAANELEIRLNHEQEGRPESYRIYILTIQKNKLVIRSTQ